MTVGEKYYFDYRKIEKSLRERLESAVEAVNLDCGQRFYLVGSFFQKVLFCCVDQMILLPLFSSRRPPVRKIVGFDMNHSNHFEPTSKPKDYHELARILQISTEEEAVVYHQVIQCDFAVVEKHSIPVKIGNDEDAMAHGFTLEPVEKDIIRQGLSIWWQEWGGALSCYKFSLENPKIVISVEQLRRGIGNFKRLPISLFR